MNTVLTYLKAHWQALPLDRYGSPEKLTCVLVTPRFKTSSHILFFVLAEGRRDPLLVAKVPRLAGDNGQLDREVGNLRRVQALQPGGFDSIPRVLAYEDYGGHRLLIETAVEGQPLRPDYVRQHPAEGIGPVTEWLIDFHRASARPASEISDWFERLVALPLAQLAGVFPENAPEQPWIEAMREAVAPLREARFPLVFEHGDFSSPNILLGPERAVGVVDWELAEAAGLPGSDIFFFLNFAAFSRSRARSNDQYLAAFREAFFGSSAWARPYVQDYCRGVGLEPRLLRALFLLCWGRYVANLVVRLQNSLNSNVNLAAESITWLRENRYYLLWKHSLEHISGLDFES